VPCAGGGDAESTMASVSITDVSTCVVWLPAASVLIVVLRLVVLFPFTSTSVLVYVRALDALPAHGSTPEVTRERREERRGAASTAARISSRLRRSTSSLQMVLEGAMRSDMFGALL